LHVHCRQPAQASPHEEACMYARRARGGEAAQARAMPVALLVALAEKGVEDHERGRGRKHRDRQPGDLGALDVLRAARRASAAGMPAAAAVTPAVTAHGTGAAAGVGRAGARSPSRCWCACSGSCHRSCASAARPAAAASRTGCRRWRSPPARTGASAARLRSASDAHPA